KFPPVPGEDDPVNLIFEGASDPREVRAALLSVNGDRTAFGLPNAFPFNCTWADAVGDEQGTWTAGAGWEAGAVQLACGPYAMRFHLRLFRHGARTLGGVHMDLQVPATTDHQVIAWKFPQQLVMIDMVRSGLLAGAPYLTDPFGPSPSHRTLPYYIHNALPVPLRALLELPLENVPAGATVPIPSNGKAMVFDVVSSFVPAQSDTLVEFDIGFNQGIPKPFCDRTQLVWVQGPVHFSLRVQINPSGRYLRTELISGVLKVTPIDPVTHAPIGPTAEAIVFEEHRGLLTDNTAEATWVVGRTLTALSEMVAESFTVGQHDSYSRTETCGAVAP
ncbi:MAG TPA: hypothetical protein VFO85_19045, partial [Vicinamibacteria bacterium]|nr:hypothetical protein [Vicinamibacteria bacterium]